MEQFLARRTALGRELLVSTDDRVANCAFRLSLESASDVFAPGSEAINDATILRRSVSVINNFYVKGTVGRTHGEDDDTLTASKPTLPSLFPDGNTM